MDVYRESYRFTPYTSETLMGDIQQSSPPLDPGFENLKRAGMVVPNSALTVVAAHPNHGLPVFLLNWVVLMLKASPEKAFVFVSSGESRKRLALKIIHRESGVNLGSGADELGNLERYMAFRGLEGLSDEGHVATAVSDYRNWIQSRRLWLADEALYIEDLETALVDIAKQLPIGAVFVDVFQRVRSRAPYPTLELKYEHIAETLADGAKRLRVPIVAGMLVPEPTALPRSPIKLGDVDGTCGLPLMAQLVLGLTNETLQEASGDGASRKGMERLLVTVLKNDSGSMNGRARLLLKRTKLLVLNDDEQIPAKPPTDPADAPQAR